MGRKVFIYLPEHLKRSGEVKWFKTILKTLPLKRTFHIIEEYLFCGEMFDNHLANTTIV